MRWFTGKAAYSTCARGNSSESARNLAAPQPRLRYPRCWPDASQRRKTIRNPRRRHRRGRNVGVMGLWDVVVPLGSVLITAVATGTVTIWSKHIDAKSRREDRQHARALDYEGRFSEDRKALLLRLVSVSQLIRRQALKARRWDELTEQDTMWGRVDLVRALAAFADAIGGEEGISEVTLYASTRVRNAVDEMRELIEERLHPLTVPPFCASENRDPSRTAVVRPNGRRRFSRGEAERRDQYTAARREKFKLLRQLAAAHIDIDPLIALCDRIIDVARQHLQGRD